jgi:hypothetical protein
VRSPEQVLALCRVLWPTTAFPMTYKETWRDDS